MHIHKGFKYIHCKCKQCLAKLRTFHYSVTCVSIPPVRQGTLSVLPPELHTVISEHVGGGRQALQGRWGEESRSDRVMPMIYFYLLIMLWTLQTLGCPSQGKEKHQNAVLLILGHRKFHVLRKSRRMIINNLWEGSREASLDTSERDECRCIASSPRH